MTGGAAAARRGLAYYNEHDPKAAAWLKELIRAGLIAPGIVDTRSIEDVVPDELDGFSQCHFFAGIGGWSYALRLAGWPDDRPVWTGSCPCQPFSSAGKGLGTADERHLWPAFHWLIGQRRPAIVFGEQVASRAGRDWLATVRADLEILGYGVGAADLCAAGVGAPHIRQRLYFVAESDRGQRDGRAVAAARHERNGKDAGRTQGDGGAAGSSGLGLLADTQRGSAERRGHELGAAPGSPEGEARERERLRDDSGSGRESGGLAHDDQAGFILEWGAELLDGERPAQRHDADGRSPAGGLGHTEFAGLEGFAGHGDARRQPRRHGADPAGSVATSGGTFWSACDWLPCRDGKARPVEPGTFPLAHGIPARVGRLRGYGNAIVPQVAAAFVRAAL